jgi:hypothetical protein
MITAKEILEHRKFHCIDKGVEDMSVREYELALKKDALILVDSHGFISDSFTGMPLAVDGEQLTALISHLESLREFICGKNYNSGHK